jgi:hypothetical protein
MNTKQIMQKITKDERASRRKRSEGVLGKNNQLQKKVNVELYSFVVWTDDNRIFTYDSSGGQILQRVPELMARLVSHNFKWWERDSNQAKPHHPQWDKRDPAYYLCGVSYHTEGAWLWIPRINSCCVGKGGSSTVIIDRLRISLTVY